MSPQRFDPGRQAATSQGGRSLACELTALIAISAIDGLSIGFRTVKGRVDPVSRVRKLIDVDLWEISIVTFPLLAGARVRAKGSESAPISSARARADDERLLRRYPRYSFTRARASSNSEGWAKLRRA